VYSVIEPAARAELAKASTANAPPPLSNIAVAILSP